MRLLIIGAIELLNSPKASVQISAFTVPIVKISEQKRRKKSELLILKSVSEIMIF